MRDSILPFVQEQARAGPFLWLTPTLAHAKTFMRGAQSVIGFAVLLDHSGPQRGSYDGAITLSEESHALPLFHITLPPPPPPLPPPSPSCDEDATVPRPFQSRVFRTAS